MGQSNCSEQSCLTGKKRLKSTATPADAPKPYQTAGVFVKMERNFRLVSLLDPRIRYSIPMKECHRSITIDQYDLFSRPGHCTISPARRPNSSMIVIFAVSQVTSGEKKRNPRLPHPEIDLEIDIAIRVASNVW